MSADPTWTALICLWVSPALKPEVVNRFPLSAMTNPLISLASPILLYRSRGNNYPLAWAASGLMLVIIEC